MRYPQEKDLMSGVCTRYKMLGSGERLDALKVVKDVETKGANLVIFYTDGKDKTLSLPSSTPANVEVIRALNASGTAVVAELAALKTNP